MYDSMDPLQGLKVPQPLADTLWLTICVPRLYGCQSGLGHPQDLDKRLNVGRRSCQTGQRITEGEEAAKPSREIVNLLCTLPGRSPQVARPDDITTPGRHVALQGGPR